LGRGGFHQLLLLLAHGTTVGQLGFAPATAKVIKRQKKKDVADIIQPMTRRKNTVRSAKNSSNG
jgi:hypothetical protein